VAPDMADAELVASIQYPADDPLGLAPPNAIPEVFYRIVSRNGRGGVAPVDELVAELDVPLLLLWGEKDPWIVSAIGDRFLACAQALGKDVRRRSVDAGHCPHDEDPEAVNAALLEFATYLEGYPEGLDSDSASDLEDKR
jgi:pimeloyl-ACP methyl ester carboxylesterase